jgi:hypothetical protein
MDPKKWSFTKALENPDAEYEFNKFSDQIWSVEQIKKSLKNN